MWCARGGEKKAVFFFGLTFLDTAAIADCLFCLRVIYVLLILSMTQVTIDFCKSANSFAWKMNTYNFRRWGEGGGAKWIQQILYDNAWWATLREKPASHKWIHTTPTSDTWTNITCLNGRKWDSNMTPLVPPQQSFSSIIRNNIKSQWLTIRVPIQNGKTQFGLVFLIMRKILFTSSFQHASFRGIDEWRKKKGGSLCSFAVSIYLSPVALCIFMCMLTNKEISNKDPYTNIIKHT